MKEENMNVVSLILKSEYVSANDLEEILEALKPILELTTTAKATIIILQEN